jgi:hypothetical protein
VSMLRSLASAVARMGDRSRYHPSHVRLRRAVPAALLALAAACAAAAPSASGQGAPAALPDVSVRIYFPDEAFDGICSYGRPIRSGEELSTYVRAVADRASDQVTDLDCFAAGSADMPPHRDGPSRYFYANAFLIIRHWGTLRGHSPGELSRTLGLGDTRLTGEMLYTFAAAAAANEQLDCGQALAAKASTAGVASARLLWRDIESQRQREDGHRVVPRPCADPVYRTMLGS